MVTIENCRVYDLAESIIASSYAMMSIFDEEQIQWRVENLNYWMRYGDFLPNFIKFYNNQDKNLGSNTKDSCLKCGSSKKVQRVCVGSGGGNFYCGKHCHELYRYGEIKDHIIYTFLPNNHIRLDVTGDKNITRQVVVSAIDIPLIFGKNIQVHEIGYLIVDGVLFHRLVCQNIGVGYDEVDHIDRNPNNSTRENMRPCTKRDNLLNKGKQKKLCDNESEEVVGVNFRKDRNKWRAYITVGRKQINLGVFCTKEQAILARLKKEKELFGEYSPNLNLFEKYGISKPIQQNLYCDECKYDLELAVKDFGRILKLANTPQGSGHRNALKGIRVAFDIIYPNYISPEMQRYHFFDIVTSSSKMHKLTSMDMDACFNKYVTQESKDQMKRLLDDYSKAETNDDKYTCFMRLLSNCPQGIELFMRVTTNYEQLATIYRQRKNHVLREDWSAFCNMIESLPYAKELIICDNERN